MLSRAKLLLPQVGLLGRCQQNLGARRQASREKLSYVVGRLTGAGASTFRTSDASFTQVDNTHWQVNYHANTEHDIITFLNGAGNALHPSDFTFA